MVNWHSKQLSDLLAFGILIAMMGIFGYLGEAYFFRWDLTEDKRYTLSPYTQRLLEEIDEEIYVEVYLDGNLPPGFIRLRNSLFETLEEFRRQTKGGISIRILDPLGIDNQEARNEFISQLAEKGIQATNVFATEEGRQIQRLVFPGLSINIGGREQAVNLLKGNRMVSAEEALNQSIEGLEFALAEAIQQLSTLLQPRIGLVQGHGEWDSLDIAGLTAVLKTRYEVNRLRISDFDRINGFDALIIANPTQAFSEEDKYKLDQYLMRGGKLLFFLDALKVNLSDVQEEENFAIAQDVNLNDLLFKYGVRINPNYVQDINSSFFPLVTGNFGDRPDIRLMPWPFYPIVTAFGDHPIVRNMDALWLRFASSMDTVKSEGVTKTPLLQSSPYTRVVGAPAPVVLNDVRDLKESDFNSGIQHLGYLLEGSFNSLYQNRFAPDDVDTTGFRARSLPTQILVIADGDFVKSERSDRTGQVFPMGFDPYDQQQFAHEDFILNTLHYMLDEDRLILARNKTIGIRPLDRVKAEREKTYWQILNLSAPIFLVLLIGGLYQWLYRRKYWKKTQRPHEK
jgi:gliding-associated putative ABC transporter substrate-binding component GldG